jgi:hypothetical protein
MEGGPDTPHAIKTEGMGLKHTRKSDCWPRRLRFDSGPRGSISITAASADNSPVNGTSATVFRSMSRVRARPPGIPCDGGEHGRAGGRTPATRWATHRRALAVYRRHEASESARIPSIDGVWPDLLLAIAIDARSVLQRGRLNASRLRLGRPVREIPGLRIRAEGLRSF